MDFETICKSIESPEMAARLGVNSTLDYFLEDASVQPSVRALLKAVKAPDNMDQLLLRVFSLARQTVDLRYENEWDTALAIYCWLLNNRDPLFGAIAAEVTSKAPACDWASQIAQEILQMRPLSEDAHQAGVIPYEIEGAKGNTTKYHAYSGDTFLRLESPMNIDGVAVVIPSLQPSGLVRFNKLFYSDNLGDIRVDTLNEGTEDGVFSGRDLVAA